MILQKLLMAYMTRLNNILPLLRRAGLVCRGMFFWCLHYINGLFGVSTWYICWYLLFLEVFLFDFRRGIWHDLHQAVFAALLTQVFNVSGDFLFWAMGGLYPIAINIHKVKVWLLCRKRRGWVQGNDWLAIFAFATILYINKTISFIGLWLRTFHSQRLLFLQVAKSLRIYPILLILMYRSSL